MRDAGYSRKLYMYNSSSHEIERNLSLLGPLNFPSGAGGLPRLYPSHQDAQIVNSFLHTCGYNLHKNMIAIAPGTIWNTKRWPADRFAVVSAQLASDDNVIVLIGGKEDEILCKEVMEIAHVKNVFSAAGKLSLLQSAELIRRCKVLISNDSAPMHIAVAVETPVIAIFGATIPGFGFAPRGHRDVVVETNGLPCRPCSIHGGNICPIKTFACMLAIAPELVVEKVKSFLENSKD